MNLREHAKGIVNARYAGGRTEGEVVNLKAPKAEAEAIRRWARERRMSTSYAVGIAIRALTESAERHG